MYRKKDPNHTHTMMGGNLINYPEDVGTNMATLLLIKIFLNGVISTLGVRFMSTNLANFYLTTPLERPEFSRIMLSNIPEEVIQEYSLYNKATRDGWVYLILVAIARSLLTFYS